MSTQSGSDHYQKGWLATINNPTEDEKNFILTLEAEEVVADEEAGQQEETPHIHAYILFPTKKRLSALKHLLPRAHWDPVHSMIEARNYCRKGHVIRDQTRVQTQGSRTRQLVQLALEKGPQAAAEEDIYLFCKNRRLILEAWSFQQQSREYQKPLVFWLYGGTASGKTRYVFEHEAGNLSSIPCNKAPLWFDSYKMWYEAVLLDDFRADVCELHWLLQILDRYPIDVPIKGGFVAWRPKRIYITAPFPPEGIYKNVCDENMQQLRRRIDHVMHFVSLNRVEPQLEGSGTSDEPICAQHGFQQGVSSELREFSPLRTPLSESGNVYDQSEE